MPSTISISDARHARVARIAARLRGHRRALLGDHLRRAFEQRGGRPVDAGDRRVAGGRLEARGLECVEAAAITVAHRRMRARELLDERSAVAGRQLLDELRGERIDGALARLERVPVFVEHLRLLAAQQRVLPFLDLQLNSMSVADTGRSLATCVWTSLANVSIERLRMRMPYSAPPNISSSATANARGIL
jgi:hypothetical protein